MNKTLSAIRIAILAILTTTAAVCILSEPLDTYDMPRWLLAFIASKAIGAAALIAVIRIYPHWCRSDRFIAAFDRWCSRGIENA